MEVITTLGYTDKKPRCNPDTHTAKIDCYYAITCYMKCKIMEVTVRQNNCYRQNSGHAILRKFACHVLEFLTSSFG